MLCLRRHQRWHVTWSYGYPNGAEPIGQGGDEGYEYPNKRWTDDNIIVPGCSSMMDLYDTLHGAMEEMSGCKIITTLHE